MVLSVQASQQVGQGEVIDVSSRSIDLRKMLAGKLYAISDIYIGFADNKVAWSKLKRYSGDGLILCGDVGDFAKQLRSAFQRATECFDIVWWCSGNYELYTLPNKFDLDVREERKYQECVDIAREYNVLSLEDEFVVWEGEGDPAIIASIFTLYDYSFRPDDVSLEGVVAWAREKNTEATDEFLLYPDSYSSWQDWCKALV